MKKTLGVLIISCLLSAPSFAGQGSGCDDTDIEDCQAQCLTYGTGCSLDEDASNWCQWYSGSCTCKCICPGDTNYFESATACQH